MFHHKKPETMAKAKEMQLVIFGVWLVERIEPGYFTDNELFEFLTFTDELLVQLGIIQEAIEIYMY